MKRLSGRKGLCTRCWTIQRSTSRTRAAGNVAEKDEANEGDAANGMSSDVKQSSKV